MHRRIGTLALLPAACAFLALGSCGGDSTSPTHDIRDYITGLSTSNGAVNAAFHAGAAPTGGTGPAVNATGSSAMILGGITIRSLSSSTAFTRVIVALQGVDGYWELSLPSSVTAQDILLALAQSVPQETFTVQYAAGTASAVGVAATEPVNVITVGTGDVQVSVSWDLNSDVDLHLVEPGGEEIYWSNQEAASGGTLDLDSNPACFIDGKRNENITWPSGKTPPKGTYTVRVDYFDSCNVTATKYAVIVRVKGQAAKTFSGTFTGTGDGGAQGSGTTITTFTY